MATTPEGTPYVESSDLVANYPAASLSLANRVDLVGVLPFASAAARTTAIPSPTDGQYVYLQDTNTTQFYNGAAWETAGQTPGLHLVTPTSIANSGGSASASGGAVTFTGVSSISLNGVFSATYENYLFIFRATSNTSSPEVRFRLRVSGSDASGTNYIYEEKINPPFSVSTGQTSFRIAQTSTTGGGAYVVASLFRPFLTQQTGMHSDGTELVSTIRTTIYGGEHGLSTSYDGLTFFPSANNITGTIRVYGYQNS